MATNLRSSFIVPELLADAVETAFASGLNLLFGTAAVVQNPTLPTSARGGDVVKVPYLGNIGEFEDVAEDVALTPVAMTSAAETAAVARSGKAITITKWAEIANAYEKPYEVLAKQMQEGAARRIDSSIIAAAQAAYAGGTPGNTAGLVYDVSASADPKLSYNNIVDLKLKWGDEQDDFAMMAMHSAKWGDLLKLKDADGRPMAIESVLADGRTLRQFAGCPVAISDKLTPTSSVYPTLFVKKGALAAWYNPTPSIQTLPDVLKDSTIASVNIYYVAYRYRLMAGKRLPGVGVLKTL